MTDMRDTLGDALHGPPSSKGGLHGLRRLLPFFGNAANGRARTCGRSESRECVKHYKTQIVKEIRTW